MFVVGALVSTVFSGAVLLAGDKPLPKVKAPDFVVYSEDGRKVTLSSLRGRVVLLEFFGEHCPYCARMVKELNMVYRNYSCEKAGIKKRKRGDCVEIVAIMADRGTTPSKLKKYKKNKGVFYNLYYAKSPEVFVKYGLRGVPTIFLIDKNGYARFMSYYIPYDKLEPYILKVMKAH